MDVIDAHRAQFFLRKLLSSLEIFDKELFKLEKIIKINSNCIKRRVEQNLVDELDRIILPTVAKEIYTAKQDGILSGKTAYEKYVSYFLNKKGWSPAVTSFLTKYKFLNEIIIIYINTFMRNVIEMLTHLHSDMNEIRTNFNYSLVCLESIQSNISDRHKGGRQALLLTFSEGQKFLYKPTNLESDNLFKEYVEFLKLPKPFDLKTVTTLNKGEYGWIKHLNTENCDNIEQIKRFYIRAGVLLAVADQLNYTDGHLENLLACSEHPVLIDLETLFHPLSGQGKDSERSVLNTGLVEKPPPDLAHKGFTAALQTPGYRKYEILFPYPVNDKTDCLKVKFRGSSDSLFMNAPIIDDMVYSPVNFVSEFLHGYDFATKIIMVKAKDWIANRNWWDRVEKVEARLLIRHTLYYELMIRKIQQPDIVTEKMNATTLLYKLMKNKQLNLDVFLDYEVFDLTHLDIPYFKHQPFSRNIIDGNGKVYLNSLLVPSIQELFSNFKRGEEYFNRNKDILLNILKASPSCIKMEI